MLSVLHVGTSRTFRGGEQQVFFLLQGLRERGVLVTAVLPPEAPLAVRARAVGIPVVPLAARGDLDLPAALALRNILVARRPRILHLHTARAHAMGRLALAGFRRRPATIVSRQVAFPTKGGPFRKLKYGRGVDRFVAVSRAAAASVQGAGVASDRITVVPCGIDLSVFQVPPDRDGLMRELAIPEASQLIGFAGALEEEKGPGDLLEVLARLPSTVHLVLTGEGRMEGVLRERSQRPDLVGRVHLLGWREDFPRILRSLDAFCLPSRHEGFPNAILDALAAEVPVVGSRVGGVPEILDSGRDGLLVEVGDLAGLSAALLRVLGDPAFGASLVREGRRTVLRFTADRMVESILAVYQEVLADRSGSVESGGEGASSC